MALKHLAKRYIGTEESVWVVFTALARQHNAVNLGQGFPDYADCVPLHVRKSLAEVTMSDNALMNQYTRGFGHPPLVQNLSKLYSKEFRREINAMDEILVTGGAYEALFCSFQSLLNEGDEVIIIEPFYDCYHPMAVTAGAKSKFVPLRPTGHASSSGDWKIDPNELKQAFTPKTKLLIINNPNNPLGKVYTQEELEMISKLCVENDILCISDEVYEWLAIPPKKHLRIANMPGMWERTVTIGSAGKTFSTTGWKLGWAIGPKELIGCLQVAHQNCVYTCPTPTQQAAANGFETEIAKFGQPDCYFQSLANDQLKPKRDLMVDVLKSSGFDPIVPEGGYFMMADWTKHKDLLPPPANDAEAKEANDVRFVKWLTSTHKLATIPITCFFSEGHRSIGENYIRFCYIKKDETLLKAKEILQSLPSAKL